MSYLIKNHIYIFSFIFFFVSCSDSQHNTEIDQTSLKEFGLIISDSLEITCQATELWVLDYHENNKTYLCYDFSTKQIVEFDEQGEVKLTLKAAQNDDQGYGTGHLSGLGYKDDSIVVVSQKGVHFYDRLGKLGRKIIQKNIQPINITHPRAFFYTFEKTENLLIPGIIFNFSNSESFNSTTKKYYDQINSVMHINLDSSTFNHIIPIHSSSIYRTSNLYYVHLDPYFFFDANTRTISLIRGIDKNIYTYSMVKDNQFELKKITPTYPENFPEFRGNKFGNSVSNMEQYIKEDFLTPFYTGIYSKQDTTILNYVSALAQENVRELTTDINKIRESSHKRKKYLEVYVNHQKIARDIELPKYITQPFFISPTRFVAFKNKYIQNEELDQEVLYIYRIMPKKK